MGFRRLIKNVKGVIGYSSNQKKYIGRVLDEMYELGDMFDFDDSNFEHRGTLAQIIINIADICYEAGFMAGFEIKKPTKNR